MTDEPLASIRRRVDAFLNHEATNSTDDLLAPAALVDVEAAVERDRRDHGGVSLDVMHAVAWLHWCRHLARSGGRRERAEPPEDEGEDEDLAVAAGLFAQLALIDRELVPEHGRAELPRWQARQAADILRKVLTGADAPSLGLVVALLEHALDDGGLDRIGQAGALGNLGLARRARFELTGDGDDFESAVRAHRRSVEAMPDGHPEAAALLGNAGLALRAVFERTGSRADLDEAVAACRRAVELTEGGDVHLPGRLSNLSATLWARYDAGGDPGDLDEAVAAALRALEAAPNGHPDRVGALSNLGLALQTRYGRAGVAADLDRAIECGEAVVAHLAQGHSARAGALANLGLALRTRYELRGRIEDLDRALDLGRQAVDGAPPGGPNRAMHIFNVATALLLRFQSSGALPDLNQAIGAGREAVACAEAGIEADSGRQSTPPLLPVSLSGLGAALRIRYTLVGDPADLNEAVEVGTRAVEVAAAQLPDRAAMLVNLAGALCARFTREGASADIDAGIAAMEEAIGQIPPDNPRLAAIRTDLGIAYRDRYDASGDPADLHNAVAHGRHALAAIAADHPERPAVLANLAGTLLRRYRLGEGRAELDEAVAVCREAVETTPEAHHDRAVWQSMLAGMLRTSAAEAPQAGEAADNRSAIELWQAAAALPTAAVSVRMKAARRWADCVLETGGSYATAADGYRKAVELLPLHVWRGLDRRAGEYLLAEAVGLSTDAAACEIGAGRPDSAVELLEQGRAVLWSRVLDTRTELGGLRSADPDLAGRLESVRTLLDALSSPSATGIHGS